MDDEIVARAEALSRGLSRYFTGEPCRAGHVAERYTTSANCVECAKALRDRSMEEYRRLRAAAKQV